MEGKPISSRALWFTEKKRAELREVSIRPPRDHEIQVRAICSLISPGTEMALYRGIGNLPDLLLPTAEGTLPFPIKFGYQVVGRVERAGASSGYQEGDLVFSRHPHQERFTVPTDSGLTLKLPETMDPSRAAFMVMCGVSLQTLLEVPIRVGDMVVVSGLGLIGSLAAYMARKTAGRLIVIDPVAERRERAEWVKADACVAPEAAAAAISELTDGRGADVFIETSGAPPALQTALDHTGIMGTIAIPAWYGSRPVTLSLSPEFHLRAQKIVSIHVGRMGGDLAARWTPERRSRVALEVLKGIDVGHLITHRVPFEKAPTGYQILDQSPENALGVLLEYGSESSMTGGHS